MLHKKHTEAFSLFVYTSDLLVMIISLAIIYIDLIQQ